MSVTDIICVVLKINFGGISFGEFHDTFLASEFHFKSSVNFK